ncbi:hypothetical protein LJC37_03975 [Bacteroidales bacterium OttesenSCG-928-E04]|nr:hypothetical protein [Bacteroidales bacterium OttesenSCG-928-E04]MDL2326567.1 hypothetical protein [Bacteroidales bacterium OttesenSCG-928-A14]
MSNINLEKEKIADGFTVPDGYFDSLEDIVFQQIHLEKKKKNRNRILLFTSTAAACAIIAFGVAFFTSEEKQLTAFNEIETTVNHTDEVNHFFAGIEEIEAALLAYNPTAKEQIKQTEIYLEEKIATIEELIDSDKLQDEDYQMIDYYIDDFFSDLYY